MGKTLLIDTSPIPDNPTTSHCRTIQEISRRLGLPLISTSEELHGMDPGEYSRFVVMGSALSIAPSLELKNPEFRHIMSYRIPVHEKT